MPEAHEPLILAQVPPGLPPSLAQLTAPCYLHRTPAWIHVLLLALALAVVLGVFGYLGYRMKVRGLDWGETALGLFLLPFLLLLLRPSTWRPPVALAADRSGLYFVGGRESVRVPWEETGPFTVERVRLMSGVGRSVVATIAAGSSFWDAARASRFRAFLLGTEQPPGFLRIALGNPCIEPERTRSSLEALRRAQGSRQAR